MNERGNELKINEVIVVEGKSDTMKIKQAVDADTIETNGSAVNCETLDVIRHAQEKRGVIIFTDPDYPGERIRHIVDQNVPGCKHAFLPKREADSGKKTSSVGVEHASVQAIQEALRQVHDIHSSHSRQVSSITRADLVPYGLLGGACAKARREALGEYLHIGYTNGKQLLNRLHMFNITQDELKQAMQHILKRGDCHE